MPMKLKLPISLKPIVAMTIGVSLALLFFLSRSSSTGRIFKETRPSMYTVVSITVVSASEDQARKTINASFDELDRLATLLNFYSDASEISMINRHAGDKPVKVSRDTLDILEKAVYVSEMTEGAFDVTVGPLVKLWDIQHKVIPDRKSIEEKLQIVGYKNIVIDKAASTVFIKRKGGQIDLGGIIKGYAVDKVVGVLHKNGIKSGVVTVGGEIRALGRKPDGTSWLLGVQNPRQKGPDDQVIATLELSDKALSTSGDYIRYFEKDGVRYHHLLDPKTGYPSHQCGSATIVADDNTTTDGFSKLFILGPEKGLAVAKKLGFDVLFIDCKGQIVMSDGLKNKIRFAGVEKSH
jgi:thiamine biosynthesis lipoprotein